MLHGLQQAGIDCQGAQNDLTPGISRVTEWLANGQLFVVPGAKETIREFGSYEWDSNERLDILLNTPKPKDDHTMDALRYVIMGLTSPQRAATVKRYI